MHNENIVNTANRVDDLLKRISLIVTAECLLYICALLFKFYHISVHSPVSVISDMFY